MRSGHRSRSELMARSRHSLGACVVALVRRAFVTALAILACSATAAESANADVIAREQRATPLSASGDSAVWSSWDPSTGTFRLRYYANGIARFLHVRGRSVPFDADL